MNMDSVFNLLAGIVVVAGITTVVARGDKAAKVIGALSSGFSDSISASLGRGINFA